MSTMQAPAAAADAIRTARGDSTQMEFSALTGVSQTHISHLESGRRRLTLGTAVRIERAAGLEPYSLVRLADPEPATLPLSGESGSSAVPGLLSHLALSVADSVSGALVRGGRPSPALAGAAA